MSSEKPRWVSRKESYEINDVLRAHSHSETFGHDRERLLLLHSDLFARDHVTISLRVFEDHILSLREQEARVEHLVMRLNEVGVIAKGDRARGIQDRIEDLRLSILRLNRG